MLFSIIVPTRNSATYISRCLDSVFSQSAEDFEIIVVDNGSNDSTCNLIMDQYPKVTLVRNTENRGSAAARNQGVTVSKGKYVVFLDSDTYIEYDFFEVLKKKVANMSPGSGAISAKILDASSHKIFSCGLSVAPNYRVRDIGRGKESARFIGSFNVDGPNSCCAVFNKETLETIKDKDSYFDEGYFFLYEDVDVALRLKQKKISSVFVPELVCHHHNHGSDIANDYRRYLCFRNRWYTVLKNKKGKELFLFMLRSFPYDFIRTLHFALTNRYFFKAVKDICRRKK